MRVIGVIDLLGARAVHARGGHRDRYAPVRASGGVLIEGDAPALARAYLDRFRLRELYVADLDAILGGTKPAAVTSALAALGAPVWLDAGVSSVEDARVAIEVGAARVVVGLETLTSFDALASICDAVGSDRVAFSLDLRDGVPLAIGEFPLADGTPERLAARAVDAGASAVTVIDVRRVGTGRGVDVRMLSAVRCAVPHVTLIAGGGVRTTADIHRLADAGCDGVLIATALHDGSIGPTELTPYLRPLPGS